MFGCAQVPPEPELDPEPEPEEPPELEPDDEPLDPPLEEPLDDDDPPLEDPLDEPDELPEAASAPASTVVPPSSRSTVLTAPLQCKPPATRASPPPAPSAYPTRRFMTALPAASRAAP